MKRRIKVLRVVIGLNLGGVQQGVLNLCRHLDPERYEPIVCALENDGVVGREIARAGFEVIVLGLKGKAARPRIISELYRLLRSRRIDLVHGSSYHPSLLSRLAGWLARVPLLVSHEHTIYQHFHPHRALVSHLLGRTTQAHIAVSQVVRQQVLSWYRLDPDKVHVIYNGARPEFFKAGALRRASRRKLGLSPETRVLGMVSRLHLGKGFNDLFAALAGLNSRMPLRLLLVGIGPHEQEIRELAARHGLGEAVEFLGHRRDVPELLAAMDAFVLPSLQEGFSNALIEAMAVGLPVIVSDHQGNLEAVEPGVSGLIYPQGDVEGLKAGLAQVLEHPRRARRWGQAAQARVAAHFTVEGFGRQVQALYDRLVRERIDPGW